MDNHTIFKIEDKNHEMIILLKSKGAALYNEHLNKTLRNMKLPICKIVFDRLLIVGNTRYRFVEMLFNGEQIIYSSSRNMKVDKTRSFRKTSSYFLKNNQELLGHCALSDMQIDRIRPGFII